MATKKKVEEKKFEVIDLSKHSLHYTIEIACDLMDAYQMEEGIVTALCSMCSGVGYITKKDLVKATIKQLDESMVARHRKIQDTLEEI